MNTACRLTGEAAPSGTGGGLNPTRIITPQSRAQKRNSSPPSTRIECRAQRRMRNRSTAVHPQNREKHSIIPAKISIMARTLAML